MADLTSFQKDFILLLESGFIAVNQADENSAVKLFKAAQLLDNKNTLPIVGLGYLHLHKLELRQAVELFEKVLKQEPDNEMAKTFLGLCLTFTPQGLEKGEEILAEMKKSNDRMIHNLSITAMNFVDSFIKKEPTPVEVKKKKNNKRKR